MSDEAREYIRAAQAAEISGDKARAVEMLKKAAVLFRDRGNHSRALQMLRHARRLDVGVIDVEEEIKRLEWIPDDPLGRAAIVGAEDQEDDEADRALAVLDDVAGPAPKQLVERGPTRADPSLQAWCSFCCRPRTEVGDLVAGPAGAFICQKCLRESAKLLGAELPKGGGARNLDEVMQHVSPATEPEEIEFLGQPEAVHVVDSGLRLGARTVLLLGPEGTGKSTYLRHLEKQGLGVYVDDPAALDSAMGAERVLLDVDPEQLGSPKVRALVETVPVVISIRAQPLVPSITLVSESLELPLVSGVDLVAATGGKLPLAIADRVQVVASFRALTNDELEEIARRLLLPRAVELELGEELLAALAQLASTSGRGGHELAAFVRRLPPGSWNLKTQTTAAPVAKTAAAGSKRRSKKKGEDG
jgi:hypothetical protein